jgi:fumarate reductase flavoprotein subunit
LNSTLTWIWRADADPASPVLGVEIKRGKKVLNLRANRAVVLASGGFGRDVAMRTIYNPSLGANYNSTNHLGATGESIRYAQAVGAEAIHMAFIQLYPYAEPETGLLDAPAVYPFRGPGFGIVYVNKAGKRFVNENERRDVVARAELATGTKPTFSIFNEKMISHMGTKEEVEQGLARGRFVKGETLAELAGKLGLPPDTLQETITKHNQFMKDGKDTEFNRTYTKAMLPLDEGPFYGIAQWPAVHFCMGGLRINGQAQVLDVFSKPIPRFYAAGEVTGGIHGSNRLGGNATGSCTVFGRIAGVNAAKEPVQA